MYNAVNIIYDSGKFYSYVSSDEVYIHRVHRDYFKNIDSFNVSVWVDSYLDAEKDEDVTVKLVYTQTIDVKVSK